MAECISLPKCLFFNDKMAEMPGTAKMIKDKMCRGDNKLCARFMVLSALGRDKVPADLYPNMVDRAKKLIATSS